MNVEEKSVDVVIAWVDGDDPAHKAKMRPYLTNAALERDDVAGATRFRSDKEIFFCIASIIRFAPFVRKIFIVTDGQDPGVEGFIAKNFPNNGIPVELVDHKDIFRGYEEYLPTFNSLSIGSALFRIPGLSENFVYFNDDVMLLRPVSAEEWFEGDKIVAYGKWRSIPLYKMISSLKPRKGGHKPFGFKDAIMNASARAGMKRSFLLMGHTPHPAKRSLFEEFYAANPEVFGENISHRFRYPTQYSAFALCYMLASRAGRLITRRNNELYMKPVDRGDDYVARKIREYEKHRPAWGCIQSLDQATEEDRRRIREWLCGMYGVEL